MKLATLALAGVLAATGAARADDPQQEQLDPPSGPVQVELARQPMGPGPGAQPDMMRRQQLRGEMRQMLLQRFDRNHDGRLEPAERRQAIRALRRLVRRLARQDMMAGRRGRMMRQRIIDRYDVDGDGNVGPGELPPRVQQRLRRFDRNGDGWIDDADQ
jgi:EF hand